MTLWQSCTLRTPCNSRRQHMTQVWHKIMSEFLQLHPYRMTMSQDLTHIDCIRLPDSFSPSSRSSTTTIPDQYPLGLMSPAKWVPVRLYHCERLSSLIPRQPTTMEVDEPCQMSSREIIPLCLVLFQTPYYDGGWWTLPKRVPTSREIIPVWKDV